METQSGNKIHKKCHIRNSDQILLIGKVIMKDKVTIRADMAKINMGRFVILNENVILHPGYIQVQEYSLYKQNYKVCTNYFRRLYLRWVQYHNLLRQNRKLGLNWQKLRIV